MQRIFFNDSDALVRTLVVGVLAYFGLILLLRATGKRTLSKMNGFDFVVTVALGSTLASILLDRNVTLAQGVVAFATLVALQYAITWSSVRVRWVRHFVTGEPTLLLYRGRMLAEPMRRTRVTRDEVIAAIRGASLSAVEEAEAVVLETDGSFSVLRGTEGASTTSLEGVRGSEHVNTGRGAP